MHKEIQVRQKLETIKGVPNYAKQKILPNDCVRIDPFEAPQFNVIPFKVILMKKETTEAVSLFMECLKVMCRFMPVNHLDMSPKDKYQLDLLNYVRKDQP